MLRFVCVAYPGDKQFLTGETVKVYMCIYILAIALSAIKQAKHFDMGCSTHQNVGRRKRCVALKS